MTLLGGMKVNIKQLKALSGLIRCSCAAGACIAPGLRDE